jgi:hypothetical protein
MNKLELAYWLQKNFEGVVIKFYDCESGNTFPNFRKILGHRIWVSEGERQIRIERLDTGRYCILNKSTKDISRFKTRLVKILSD